MTTLRIREEASAERRSSRARGGTALPAPAEWLLAMQHSAGNRAVAGLLSRTVTLPLEGSKDREPQSAEKVKGFVTARISAELVPELDAEIAVMVGPDFERHYANEQKLVSGVIERLQSRYERAVAQSHPRATAMVGQSGGMGTLAWAVTLLRFPADLEELLARLEQLVDAEDMKRQFKDVFGRAEGMATKLADGGHEAWISGKQAQLDGLMAELRVTGRTSADQLARGERMRFGKKFSAPSASTQTESSGGTSATKRQQEVSVKADLSYTDSAGILWFVEIAEGVEGLRKKVTRLDAHQRDAYQKVAKAQTKPTRLKYVCVDPDGWMKLCNVDKKQPSPVSVMADGGWILELGNELLSTAQLAQAADNGKLLYGNYTANTIGRSYRTVWKSLSAFAADPNPVSTFTSVTLVQPDALKTGQDTKTDEPVLLRKDTLDADIKALLDEKVATVGAPGNKETPVKWAQRVIGLAKSANAAKVNEFKTNVVEKYVKEKAYTAGTFAKETRATYDPDAITNPTFSIDQKRRIADFLKTRGQGPTVRVEEPIIAAGWSIMLHYDLLGPAHGTFDTPHVQFLKGSTTKDGVRYVGDHTRAMTHAETEMLMDAPGKNPEWAVEWAKKEVGATEKTVGATETTVEVTEEEVGVS